MEAYWGSGGKAPRILDLCTRQRCGANFTATPLYPKRKSHWYPLKGRRGGRAGMDSVVKKKILPGLEPPIIQPVTQRYST
jgi:hypothetical protein